MITKRFLLLPAAALALLAAGCGDDENNSEPAASNPPAQTTTQADKPAQPAESAPAEAPAGGEDAVKETILTFTFEGDCDTMTDKFLEAQAFIGDTREERCEFFQKAFSKPQYKESDVKFRKVEVTGDKAVATVGSDIANITTDYHLVSEGGKWRIDEAT
jgi:hypothetical protein